MKRYGNLFGKVCDIENLRFAHKNARKGKKFYKEVKEMDKDPDSYLYRLQDMLENRKYKTSEYEVFEKVDKDKVREICKLPYFPDRVCQWALIQVIEPYLIKTMTDDTYSAIPNRGTHLALRRLKKALITDEEGTRYCLKLDAKKYYASIDHDILKNKFSDLFKDEDLLWLIFEIIDSTEGSTGIPIGNYLSQYSGNFYLSEFDHWVKEECGVKHYYRYMDDIVILGDSKEQLHSLLRRIRVFFRGRLKLKIKENWQVFPVDIRGIDFVGYRCFGGYTLLRKSTAKTMKKKCTQYLRKYRNGGELNHKEWSSINSYLGWVVHCDAYRLKQMYMEPLMEHYVEYYKKYLLMKGDARK